MSEKLREAQDLRNKMLEHLGDSGQPISFLSSAVDRDFETLETLAHQLDDDSRSEPILKWTATSIQLAIYGVPTAIKLRQPATPNDVSEAFAVLSRTGADTLKMFDSATVALLATANNFASVALGDTGKLESELDGAYAQAVHIPADAPEFVKLISQMADNSQVSARQLIEINRGAAAMFPLLFEYELKRLRRSIAGDLEHLFLPGLGRVARKYRRIGTAIRFGPTLGGYALDKFLETQGLPGIATELGFAASIIEEVLLSEKIEQIRDDEMTSYAAETALILGFVVLPSAAIQASRIHLTNFFYGDRFINHLRTKSAC